MEVYFGSWKLEVRSPESEDGSGKLEDGRQKSEVGRRKCEVTIQRKRLLYLVEVISPLEWYFQVQLEKG